MINVRVKLTTNADTTQTYAVYDNVTGALLGNAANILNLRLQCQARGWSLIDPPRRRYIKMRAMDGRNV